MRSRIQKLSSPLQAQRWLNRLTYNPRDTMRTLPQVMRLKTAHCLEAAMATAAILEPHDYPPLILDMDSADQLGHTVFLYRQKGKYGTVGFSRDIGLNGRKPVYRTIRSLVMSYAAPYIDKKACITQYGVLDLRTLGRDNWKHSNTSVWYVEKALIAMPHTKLKLSRAYIQRWRTAYLKFKQKYPDQQPTIYKNRRHWM